MSSQMFPILATKRIVISKDFDFTPESTTTRNVFVTDGQGGGSLQSQTTTTPASSRQFTKVKVEFLLKSRENTSISRWFSEEFMNNPQTSEYAEYLKIYFLVLDDSSAAYAGFLQSIEDRYRHLKNLPYYLLARDGVPPVYKHSEVTLAEVLQNERFTTTPVSDMSSYYEHDIYGELEIDINELNLGTSRQIHLIGYIHMDVESYLQDKGLDPLPEEPHLIESHGGDLTYDLLLERSDSLQIPFYRDSLYLNSEPYYGPAHKHTEDNPGPDGYVGWMAGSPGGDMGPPLDVITTRNYKVVSNIFDSQNEASVFGIGPVSTEPQGSSGGTLDSYLSSILDRDESIEQSRRMIELVRASSYAESKSKKNFIKRTDISANFTNSLSSRDDDSGNLSTEQSHHASVVGLDYFRLVRDMSNYGAVLNFQNINRNQNLVEQFLGASKILNIEVLRDRVTNNPYSFNEMDSLDYKKYDENEPSKKLVNTQDDRTIRPLRAGEEAYRGHLLPASTENASIREINLATVDQSSGLVSSVPGYNRFFHIKDYDLFHNVQFGVYKYTLKLTLVDGIYEVIRSTLRLVEDSYRQMNEYLNDASQPVIKNSEGLYVQGSYDFKAGAFHSSFLERDYSDTINRVLVSYARASELLSGQALGSSALQEIERAIDPRSTNIDTINHMCLTLQNLSVAIRDMLMANGDMSSSGDLKKQGQTFVAASGPGRKSRTIEVSVKCPDTVSALAEGTIVANYSNYQTEDEEGNDITPELPNLGLQDFVNRLLLEESSGRLFNNLIVPSSYSSLSFMPFQTLQYQVQPLALQPRITNNLIRTPLQSNVSSTVVSSYNGFNNLSQTQRNNQTIAINASRSQQNVISSYANKPMSVITYDSFIGAGVVMDVVKGVDPNPSRSSTPSASRAKEKLKDALEKAKRENCVDLSAELRAALRNAAYNGVSRKEVMDTAESGYADLNEIINVLGDTYDNMLGLVGALQDTTAAISSKTLQTLTEEQKFLADGLDTSSNAGATGQKRYDIYAAEAAELRVVTFDGPSVNLDLAKIQQSMPSQMEGDTYLLVKMQPMKNEDAIVAVNNAHLLRI